MSPPISLACESEKKGDWCYLGTRYGVGCETERRSRDRSYCCGSESTSFRSTSSKFSLYPVLIAICMALPQVSPKELQETLCKMARHKQNCLKQLNETLPLFKDNGTFCKGEFDNIVCWPHARPGLVKSQCPDYITNFKNESQGALRLCEHDGWMKFENSSLVWSTTQFCVEVRQPVDAEQDKAYEDEMTLITTMKAIYTTGYAISLICLVIALTVFIFFKKLHCTRNYIHMNLMISFVLRYIVVLIKDKVVDLQYSSVQPNTQLTDEVLAAYCDDFGGVSSTMIACRFTITMMHYIIVANYFWLLAEGVYLQSILSFAMTEHIYFPLFVAFGWGAPWIPVGIWVVLRLTLENEGCWEMFEKVNIWWTIRAPVLLSIAVNFVIFINIVRIIVSKLRANNMARTDYKYRLARSTLALIPLLGIHYIVFAAINETPQKDQLLNPAFWVQIAFEMTLTSIQGALISILYCFLTSEVQSEIKKWVRDWRWKKQLPATAGALRKSSTYHSNGCNATQVTTMTTTSHHVHHVHAADGAALLATPGADTPTDDRRRRSTGVSDVALGDHAQLPMLTAVASEVGEKHAKNGECSL